MFKLLVVSCMLVICLAEPFGLRSSWLGEAGRRHRQPRGCVDRAEGWRACARLNDDTLAPHGYDCSLFFYCSSEGARPACRQCPAGLYFNPQLQVCDWPDNVDCTPRPTRPPRPSRPPRPLPTETTSYPTTPADDTTDAFTTVTTSATDAPSAEPSTFTTTADIYTDATTTDEITVTETVFSWQNYIPWVRK